MDLKHVGCILIFWTVASYTISFSQESPTIQHLKDFHFHHTLDIMLGHTQISQGVQANGKRKWLALPSFALNYNYKFSPKWAIGLHNDIVTEDFEVSEHLKSGGNEKILKRAHPVSCVILTSFKPGNHFSYLLGTGAEFAHTGNLFLMRIGVEYGYHFHENWELVINLLNDIKFNSYNSFSYGIGLSRIF